MIACHEEEEEEIRGPSPRSTNLNAPEVRIIFLPFLGAHRCVVERGRHFLRHTFVSELHPAFSEVTTPQARLLLPPPHLVV